MEEGRYIAEEELEGKKFWSLMEEEGDCMAYILGFKENVEADPEHVPTNEEIETWFKLADWDDWDAAKKDLGIDSYDEVRGRWFLVAGTPVSRLYLGEEENVKDLNIQHYIDRGIIETCDF